MRHKITDEQLSIAIDMRRDGYKYKDIAEVLGCNENTLYYKLKPFKIEVPKAFKHKNDYDPGNRITVFSHNKGDRYCYDEASDCHWYHNRNCNHEGSTIHLDDCGMRDVCPNYKKKTASTIFAEEKEKSKAETEDHNQLEREFLRSLEKVRKGNL